MNAASLRWFAMGAITCAGCFLLGGLARTDQSTLTVDRLVVRESISCPSINATQFLYVGRKSEPGEPQADPLWGFYTTDATAVMQGFGRGQNGVVEAVAGVRGAEIRLRTDSGDGPFFGFDREIELKTDASVVQMNFLKDAWKLVGEYADGDDIDRSRRSSSLGPRQ